MRIGDVFLRVLAEMGTFEADVVKQAEKAGDKAGLSLGQRIKAGLGLGLKAAASVAAAALGIATKGALELENAVAAYQAATGASAQEAKAAGKIINRVAGEERTSLEAVTEVAIRVRKDLGATGPVADKLTKAFTRFARVTKQDAAESVSDFDNILDAWGLTAEDAIGIQDKLLVSNQRYGGSIVANQKALAALAPTLKAANLTVDDGIGLLNLFAASGVDADVAVTGMTKALAKVKSPEELQRLIADIIATEDPFLRAQKATDLFGAKAGPKLANVLKPGIGGLETFGVTATDAALATDKAADVIDSTFSGRVQQAISIATSKLREFGDAFGPALTGIASIATLIGPTLLKPLASALLEAGKQGGSALADGLEQVWSGAGGTVIGNNIASRLENILDPTKSTVIGNAYRKAADKAGTLYLKALFAGDALRGAVGPVIDKLGTAMGTRLGTALKVAFLAALGTIIIDLLKQLHDLDARIKDQSRDIGVSVGEQITKGTIEELQSSKAALEKAITDLDPVIFWNPFAFDAGGAKQAQADLKAQLADVNAAIATSTAAAADRVRAGGKDIGGVWTKIAESTATVETHFDDVGTSATNMAGKIKRMAALIAEKVHILTTKLAAEAQALITGYYNPIIAQEQLLVDKDTVAAAIRERNATKAGTAERHQANLTLTNAQEALDQTRTALLEAGTLSAKEQKTWLSELQAKYKTATGDAKVKLGQLIAKIKELQGVQGGGITITIKGLRGTSSDPGRGKASGGLLAAGEMSWVGERGRELIVPQVPIGVIPHAASEAIASGMASIGGSNTFHITVNPPADMSPLAGHRLAQTIADVMADTLREQTARSA